MNDKNRQTNHSSDSSEPKSLGEILPGVLDEIESGEPANERSTESSISYEEGNNAVLRNAAEQPDVTDPERADLAGMIHEGELAIEALKNGEGHSPRPD